MNIQGYKEGMSFGRRSIGALKIAGRYLAKFIDRMVLVTGYLGSALIIVAMLIVTYDVASRYFFNRPTLWAVSVSGAVLMWSTLLLAAWVMRQEAHIKIDFLLERLPTRTRVLVNCITGVLSISVCIIILWKGIEATWKNFVTGAQETVSSFGLPSGLVTLSIPVGIFFLAWQVVRRLTGHLNQFVALGNEERRKNSSLGANCSHRASGNGNKG